MKRILNTLLVLVCTFLISTSVHARLPVPLLNISNESIASGSGKPLSLDDVKLALARACVARNWAIFDSAPGKAVGTLVVNRKHTILVDIGYTEKTVSFKYKDSIDMKYGTDANGQKVIHPNYNIWVLELIDSLKVELARF